MAVSGSPVSGGGEQERSAFATPVLEILEAAGARGARRARPKSASRAPLEPVLRRFSRSRAWFCGAMETSLTEILAALELGGFREALEQLGVTSRSDIGYLKDEDLKQARGARLLSAPLRWGSTWCSCASYRRTSK